MLLILPEASSSTCDFNRHYVFYPLFYAFSFPIFPQIKKWETHQAEPQNGVLSLLSVILACFYQGFAFFQEVPFITISLELVS